MHCRIDGIGHDGQGVARIQGLAVFVPGALPGEEVEIQMVEKKRNWARARLVKLLDPSPSRVAPPCPYYTRCGGCSYQHANYALQLTLKKQVVSETLRRIGRVDTEVHDVMGMDTPWRYRNKATWHGSQRRGELQMGYFQQSSHTLLPVEDCLLISESMQAVSLFAFAQLRLLKRKEKLELTVRESSFDKRLMLLLSGVSRREAQYVKDDLQDQADSVYWVDHEKEVLLAGNLVLEERLDNQAFRISPRAFFQVNHQQASKLIKIVHDFLDLQGGESILDAYCGIGSLALGFAKKARRVVGIEAFPGAVEDARNNAAINGLDNCRFLCGLCEEILPGLEEKFDAVILDPPRSGCRPEVIHAVARMNPSKLVYVSCEPSTLARDLSHFKEAGYHAVQVQPIDMFPQTRHIETVVRLERKHN
ncbi:MAG TPA: 23S rRNA (uracil(1939)-C(5))-methyltransferase RlmD [Syntrophomonadaceae bacterium]|nr:23S rRNA (uracil(1939)-C(5))-methyltransferase RlmD [Syntrophomonadaceae bacterium]